MQGQGKCKMKMKVAEEMNKDFKDTAERRRRRMQDVSRPSALWCTRPRVKWHVLGLPSEPDKRDLTLNPSISLCLAVSCRFFFHRSARVWCGAPRAGQSMERWRSTEKQRKLHVGSTKRWAPSDLFHLASSAQTVWLGFSSLATTHPSDTHQLLACSCFLPLTVLSP